MTLVGRPSQDPLCSGVGGRVGLVTAQDPRSQPRLCVLLEMKDRKSSNTA